MLSKKPHLLSWLAVPVLLLIGFLFSQHTLGIQLYDTYYSIGNRQFVTAGSLLMLLSGLGYWLIIRAGKVPAGMLSAIHLALTIGALLTLATPLSDRDGLLSVNQLLGWLTALFVGQLVYGINILASLFQKQTKPTRRT